MKSQRRHRSGRWLRFISSGGNVGASCTNTTGLDNAFLTANELVNPATGTSPGAGLPSTLTVPTSKLNTLANALASCTASAGGSACSPLIQRCNHWQHRARQHARCRARHRARPGEQRSRNLHARHRAAQRSRRLSPPRLLTGCCTAPSRAEEWSSPASVAVARVRQCLGLKLFQRGVGVFAGRRCCLPFRNHGLRNQRILWHGARCSGQRLDRQRANHFEQRQRRCCRAEFFRPGSRHRNHQRRHLLSPRRGRRHQRQYVVRRLRRLESDAADRAPARRFQAPPAGAEHRLRSPSRWPSTPVTTPGSRTRAACFPSPKSPRTAPR
jgi:hypothetical protein